MPRYFFNVEGDVDPIGTVLPDEDAAWEEGVFACSEMIPGGLAAAPDWHMSVTDAKGDEVCTFGVHSKRR